MGGIIKWYNQNRKIVWLTIGIIILVIVLIRVLNSISHEQLSAENNVINNNTNNADKQLMNSVSMQKSESVISGEKLTTSQKNMLKILDEFVSYCSTGDTEKAYSLLSEECKEEMYPTKEVFEEGYYKQIFNGTKRKVSTQNWIGNTYKVKYAEDTLDTGTNNGYAIQDYITLITDKNGEVKLNINNYIGKEKINKTVQKDNLKFNVVETDVYMDYQTYTYEIANSSDRTVFLNDPTIDSAMYLEDQNKKQYTAYMHEISPAEMKIVPGETKKLTVKYYNKFRSNKIIKYIVFGRIILDYETYTSYGNIGNYNNYDAVQIEL